MSDPVIPGPEQPPVEPEEKPPVEPIKKLKKIPTSLFRRKRAMPTLDFFNKRVEAVLERLPLIVNITKKVVLSPDNVLQSRRKIAKIIGVKPTPEWLQVIHVAGLKYIKAS